MISPPPFERTLALNNAFDAVIFTTPFVTTFGAETEPLKQLEH